MNSSRRIYYWTILLITVAGIFGALETQAQRVLGDYQARELRAPVAVKQRLDTFRNRIQTRKLTFAVGYTYALERGIENVTGGIKPNVTAAAARRQNNLAGRLVTIDNEARLKANVAIPGLKAACSANRKTWDWRTEGKVTPVKRQKCGNCWAYASVAALESSYLIRNNKTIDGSEQYVVSNNADTAGTCKGGGTDGALEFLITKGTAMDSLLPDSGTDGTPDPNMATPYDAVTWGYVNPDAPWDPGVESIKAGVCEYGPVTTWIDAGGTFGAYTGANEYGDVYNDDDDKEKGHVVGGHFVTIIGWDEGRGAWLVKNSWGENWGHAAGFGTERGYGWIKYGTHSVGAGASWVRAKTEGYVLPKLYFELMPLKKRLINIQPNVNSPTTKIQPVVRKP